MKNRTIWFTAVALFAVVAGCDKGAASSSGNTVTFTAAMSGGDEVPATTSKGTGTFTGVLDTTTNVFTYDVSFSGLTGAATAGHIHGPAAVGASAGPILDFSALPGATFATGATSGTDSTQQ
jgi:hypothetical protein